MEPNQPEESIVIDPVQMHIVNRIAPQSRQSGALVCAGGLMLEGSFDGELLIEGDLVLSHGAHLRGRTHVSGNAYLLGTIEKTESDEQSVVHCAGICFLGSTLVASADITAGDLRTYVGMQVDGRISTMRPAQHG